MLIKPFSYKDLVLYILIACFSLFLGLGFGYVVQPVLCLIAGLLGLTIAKLLNQFKLYWKLLILGIMALILPLIIEILLALISGGSVNPFIDLKLLGLQAQLFWFYLAFIVSGLVTFFKSKWFQIFVLTGVLIATLIINNEHVSLVHPWILTLLTLLWLSFNFYIQLSFQVRCGY